jgi:hypothetical protein
MIIVSFGLGASVVTVGYLTVVVTNGDGASVPLGPSVITFIGDVRAYHA